VSSGWFRIISSELSAIHPAHGTRAVFPWMLPVLLTWGACSTDDSITTTAQVTPVVGAASSTVTPQVEKAVVDRHHLCAPICARSTELGCGELRDCQEACAELYEMPTCTDAAREFLRCLSTEPPAHWECPSEGPAAIKDGYCDEEQAALGRCLIR
jgi:hypothetical protein